MDASLRAAFVAAEQDPDRGPCGRSSTSSPSLLLHRTYETLQERMTVAVGRATGLTAPAELVAHALVAFGLAAMVWWADHDAADSTAEILDLTLLSPAKAAPVGTDVPPQACGVRAPGRP
ncbi:hypothetical protein [Streptomyces sp. NPDC048282]|uniref:hypothetical protein n=1 Tax=Streptomyces sp. NPDC048282 TaxID=3365528 RepID=UPI0037234FA4